MARISCLAGIDPDKVVMLTAVVEAAGGSQSVVTGMNVGELGKLGPALLLCDVDALKTDV